jgi:hypothetical protein
MHFIMIKPPETGLKNYQIFICGQLWSVNFDIQLLKRIFAPIFK